ncbi:MAG: ABC transporter permease [Deltaproteobacteria bacterium]|nr:MAG: ABC transporter permease [Deltaproteobacteria bacterium]TMQ27246.1 MAG: ABC transporter permease [Deltaproteobacteria bacterium]
MTQLLTTVFSLAFVAQVLRIAVPYALAAMGGAVTERSGVIDLALEAKLLFGAFAAAAVGHVTDSALLGLAGGIAAGVAVAAIQAGCALVLYADQVIIGIALNVIATAGTRFLLQILFHEGANSPPCPAYGDAVLTNPIVWLAVIATAVLPFALRRTRWGLRLRAAGDRPDALIAVGASPRRARFAAALVGGALAGAGGAQLSLAVGGFTADMSSSRGYIALVMVILAGWRPARAVLACLGVAAAEALSIAFQITDIAVPSELVGLLPYVTTLVVLMIVVARRPPASLGRV